MTVHVEVASEAAPEAVWDLYAQPERWKEWAPHVRAPRGLGSPEVEPGASGRIRLGGLAPVWAEVTAKRPGNSWTWRVGLVELTHTVEPTQRRRLDDRARDARSRADGDGNPRQLRADHQAVLKNLARKAEA